LPDGLGQHRVAQRVARRLRSEKPLVLRQRMHSGAVMALDVHDWTQSVAYLIRRYDQDLVEYIISQLPVEGTFLDVGGNVGLISFAVAARRPHARIVAFEPMPDNVAAWERNRQLNGAGNARIEPVAVSSVSGTATIRPHGDSGAAYLVNDGAGLEVPTVALDDYCDRHDIQRVDVIKLDIQGHELQALQGARRLLARGVGALLIEGFEPEVDELLVTSGYREEPVPPVGLRRWRRHPPVGDRAYVMRR
jgi:FkbM family methyltransferase